MGKTSDTAPGAAKKAKKSTTTAPNFSKSLKNCPPREFLELQTPEIQYLYSVYKECLGKHIIVSKSGCTCNSIKCQ